MSRQARGLVVADDDTIRAVVQMCPDGEATGDVGKLQQAFHSDAWMFGELAGTRYDAPIQTLFDMSAESPADTGSESSRILSREDRCSRPTAGGDALGWSTEPPTGREARQPLTA